jgi:hypothetical protein
LIGIHGFLLLREIALSSTILSLLTIMARRPGSGLVKIDQIARLRRAYSYLDAFLHLTEEAFMVSIPKIVGVLSCGFLLCFGLSNAAQAKHAPAPSDLMKTDSVTDQQGFQSDDDKQKNVDNEKGSNRAKSVKTIKGELFRVEDGNYFVKVKDGKEVRLHTDKTTQMMGEIKKGDRIEAKVNDQNHALSIRSTR